MILNFLSEKFKLIMNNNENNNQDCIICMEELKFNKFTLKCRHSFHESCVKEWCITNPSCPICRTPTDEMDKFSVSYDIFAECIRIVENTPFSEYNVSDWNSEYELTRHVVNNKNREFRQNLYHCLYYMNSSDYVRKNTEYRLMELIADLLNDIKCIRFNGKDVVQEKLIHVEKLFYTCI
jgi:hypothetical protein